MAHGTLAVFGSFGFSDIGDEAMLTEDIEYLVTNLRIPRERIHLVGNQPDYLADYHTHPRENCHGDACFAVATLPGLAGRIRRRLRSVLPGTRGDCAEAVVRRADAILVTGGGTINTRDTHGYSIRRMHRFVRFCSRHGKPVFMSGQTIGPLGVNREHDELARQIVESVDYLTTRDGYYSARYLEQIGATPRQLLLTVDDAAALPYETESLPGEVEEFIRNGFVAFNVTDYTADTPEKRIYMANLCERLVSTTGSRIVMVSHAPSDLNHLFMIHDALANDVKEYCLVPDTRTWRGGRLKRLISRARLAVGGRYHFVVFAGTSDTPFVGLCGNHYSYVKQDGFARWFGLQDFILTERDTWDMDMVMRKAKDALTSKPSVKNSLPRPSLSMQAFGDWYAQIAGRA